MERLLSKERWVLQGSASAAVFYGLNIVEINCPPRFDSRFPFEEHTEGMFSEPNYSATSNTPSAEWEGLNHLPIGSESHKAPLPAFLVPLPEGQVILAFIWPIPSFLTKQKVLQKKLNQWTKCWSIYMTELIAHRFWILCAFASNNENEKEIVKCRQQYRNQYISDMVEMLDW